MHALTQRVTLVRTETERLQDYLASLGPAAWHHPSACAGWEVGDVVAHLARGAEAYIEWITRGLRGDMAPPASAVTAAPENAAARTAHRAQRAIDIRRSLGDQLFPTFQARTARFHDFLVSLQANDWEQRCYHPSSQNQPPGPSFSWVLSAFQPCFCSSPLTPYDASRHRRNSRT
ncbi:MAG TPA: maleylpyruvate isomerase N-terminal domain-containing protein [Candidatus Tectomicrobia bacterium]